MANHLSNPVMQHFSDPILAGIDVASLGVIFSYWANLLEHPIALLGTTLVAIWYAICIYEALERRFKKKGK